MTRVIFLNYAIHKVNQSLINDGYCMSPSRHNRKPDTFMYQYQDFKNRVGTYACVAVSTPSCTCTIVF